MLFFGRPLLQSPVSACAVAAILPAGSPENVALQPLGLLCCRVLCLTGVRRSDLFRAPMEVRPSLVLDEPEVKKRQNTANESRSLLTFKPNIMQSTPFANQAPVP